MIAYTIHREGLITTLSVDRVPFSTKIDKFDQVKYYGNVF